MKRYYVVEHTFRVVHEYDSPAVTDKNEQDDRAQFYFCESSCSGNIVSELERINAIGDSNSVCLTCHAHEAKLVAAYDTEAEALVAHSAISLDVDSPKYGGLAKGDKNE